MTRLPDGYFEALYQGSPDPWGFEQRWYEERKRALTMAALPRRRFRSGFEPGCSLGLLSVELARRCDRLLVTDVAEQPLATAASRLAGEVNVRVRRWALGDPWPDESFDLVVLSEVLYYLAPAMVSEQAAAAAAALEPGGVLLAVHWRHPVADYPTGGDEVHARLAATAGLQLTASYHDDDVLVESFVRVPPAPRSVAAVDGLVRGEEQG